jgi:hypothetical protein
MRWPSGCRRLAQSLGRRGRVSGALEGLGAEAKGVVCPPLPDKEPQIFRAWPPV